MRQHDWTARPQSKLLHSVASCHERRVQPDVYGAMMMHGDAGAGGVVNHAAHRGGAWIVREATR